MSGTDLVFVVALAVVALPFAVMLLTGWQPRWLRGRSDARLRGAGGLTLAGAVLLAWLLERIDAPDPSLVVPGALWVLSLFLLWRADRRPSF